MALPAAEMKRSQEELRQEEIKIQQDSKPDSAASARPKALLFSKSAPKINFDLEGDTLNVSIDTERLLIRSAKKSDLDSYASLSADPDVMTKFATGVTRDKAFVEARINAYTDRWNKNDPFSSLAVFKRNEDDFIGHVVLGYGEKETESELAYLFNKKYWKQGIGTESVAAVVLNYAPELVKRGYKVNGHPFKSITATARKDNDASYKILENVGMKQEGESNKFGADRWHYRKSMG